LKDEFYTPKEYNSTSEYKYIPPEPYTKRIEENQTGNEQADLGKEVTTTQKPSLRQKRSDGKLLDKLFQSVKGVATATTVATVAIVGATVVATTPPTVKLNELSLGGDYVTYEITVDGLESEVDYSIVISTSNASDVTFDVDEDGVYKNTVEGLKPEWEYVISFVQTDEYLGRISHFEKRFQTTKVQPPQTPPVEEPRPPQTPPVEESQPPQTPPVEEPQPPAPQLAVSQVAISGINEVKIDFTYEHFTEGCNVAFTLDYGNGVSETTLPLSARELKNGYAYVRVSQNAQALTVIPVIHEVNENEPITCAPYEANVQNSFSTDVKVRLQTGEKRFYLKGITGNATHVKIVNAETDEELYFYECDWTIPYDYVASVYDDLEKGIYKIALTDEYGASVSNEYTVAVDATNVVEYEYNIHYVNPGEVGVTYNDDGTVNLYIKTNFETQEETLYYSVDLNERAYKSQDSVFEATGLVAQTYTLQYDVCYDVDGVTYAIASNFPSGAINEASVESYIWATVSENTVNVSASDTFLEILKEDFIRLVSSTGEEIVVTRSEIEAIDFAVTFTQPFEYVDLYATCALYEYQMDGIAEHEGVLDKTWQIRIEKT